MITNGINGFVVSDLQEFAAKVNFFVGGNQLPPEAATHLRKKIDRAKIYAELQAFFTECAKKQPGSRPDR